MSDLRPASLAVHTNSTRSLVATRLSSPSPSSSTASLESPTPPLVNVSKMVFKYADTVCEGITYSDQRTPVQRLPDRSSWPAPVYPPTPEYAVVAGRRSEVEVRFGKIIKTWDRRILNLAANTLIIERSKGRDDFEIEKTLALTDIIVSSLGEPGSMTFGVDLISGSNNHIAFRVMDEASAKSWVESINSQLILVCVKLKGPTPRLLDLLEAGGKANIAEEAHGRSALSLALINSRSDLAEILLDAGAQPHDLLTEAVVEQIGLTSVFNFLCTHVSDLRLCGCDEYAGSLLHFIARYGDAHQIQLLVEKFSHIDPDALDSRGQTPLYLSIQNIKEDLVDILVNQLHAHVNLRGRMNDSHATLAVRLQLQRTLHILEAAGLDLEAADSDGWRPLPLAVSLGQRETAEFLIERGADPSSKSPDGKSCLLMSVEAGESLDGLSRLLVLRGADLAASDPVTERNPLHMAISHGFCNLAKLIAMVDAGDPAALNARDKSGQTPLHLAARHLYFDLVSVLMDCGADPNMLNSVGETPLHALIASLPSFQTSAFEEMPMMDLLRAVASFSVHSFKPDRTAYASKVTVLHLALHKRCIPLARLLLYLYSSLVNIPDAEEHTPLHVVCAWKRPPSATAPAAEESNDIIEDGGLLQLMIELGADVNAPTGAFNTPLHLAVASNNLIASEILLNAGAESMHLNQDGLAAIHIAVQNGHLEIVESFARWMQDLNVVSALGESPLHMAVQRGDAKMARLLMNYGAFPMIPVTATRRTAAHLAALSGDEALLAALFDGGRVTNASRTDNVADEPQRHANIINLQFESSSSAAVSVQEAGKQGESGVNTASGGHAENQPQNQQQQQHRHHVSGNETAAIRRQPFQRPNNLLFFWRHFRDIEGRDPLDCLEETIEVRQVPTDVADRWRSMLLDHDKKTRETYRDPKKIEGNIMAAIPILLQPPTRDESKTATGTDVEGASVSVQHEVSQRRGPTTRSRSPLHRIQSSGLKHDI